MSQLLDYCQESCLLVGTLKDIFYEIDGEEDCELLKVFGAYGRSKLSINYDSLELFRICKLGYIRPLKLGYKQHDIIVSLSD